MGAYNRKDLKAYVRFDGTGRVVPSSLILRRKKPKVGKWVEIPAYECCDPFTPTTTTTSTSTSSTTTTTTTTGPSSYSYSVEVGAGLPSLCSGFGIPQTFYSNLSSLQVGSIMYINAELTIPYDPTAFNAFYFINQGIVYGLGYTGGPDSTLVINSIIGPCP